MTPDVSAFCTALGIEIGASANGNAPIRCPSPEHEDRHPSASVSLASGAWFCNACGAKGSPWDLAVELGQNRRGATELLVRHGLRKPSTGASDGQRKMVARYEYVDEEGLVLFQVVRFNPKDFRQRRPNGTGGWIWKLGDVRRVLYRLPQVIAAIRRGERVWVVEGERDVQSLERVGKVATTNPGGAGKWREEYSEVLCGADVTVVRDRDEPGQEHAREVAKSLQGKAAEVIIVEPPGDKDVTAHLDAGRTLDDLVRVEIQVSTSASCSASASELEHSWVDLIALRRAGLPERQYVLGAHGLLPKAKRIHVAAERKTGKSLALGIVVPLEVVAAGGTVFVLDRENGADEYARRLDDVLAARGADAAFEEVVRARYRYHAWPSLKLEWGKTSSYAAAFEGADLVIFDSSRTFLTSVGLDEDSSDDYSAFVEALIDPLMRSGATTLILDNTGHSETTRARGTSAKGDLADIALSMRTINGFSPTQSGRLGLRCEASRIGELGGASWQMSLGDGSFGLFERIGTGPTEAREDLRDATVRVLVDALPRPLGQTKIAAAIRALPAAPTFRNQALRDALRAWSSDPESRVLRGPVEKGFTTHAPSTGHSANAPSSGTQAGTGGPQRTETLVTAGDSPMPNSPGIGGHQPHAPVPHPLQGGTDGQRDTNRARAVAEGKSDVDAPSARITEKCPDPVNQRSDSIATSDVECR